MSWSFLGGDLILLGARRARQNSPGGNDLVVTLNTGPAGQLMTSSMPATPNCWEWWKCLRCWVIRCRAARFPGGTRRRLVLTRVSSRPRIAAPSLVSGSSNRSRLRGQDPAGGSHNRCL